MICFFMLVWKIIIFIDGWNRVFMKLQGMPEELVNNWFEGYDAFIKSVTDTVDGLIID